MSYRFSFQKDATLLVVVFEGEIPPEEEQRALVDVSAHPEFDPRSRILVDHRKAYMKVGPKDVDLQIDLAQSRFPAQPHKPKMALLVASDYDFGMSRMLELTASVRDGPHEIRVFRDLDEACSWLGVEPNEIEWPSSENP